MLHDMFLSDKYAVSTAKFNGDELGFLMAAATAVFMACCLPFLDRTITLSWQSFAAIGLLCLSKILNLSFRLLSLMKYQPLSLRLGLVSPFSCPMQRIFSLVKSRAFSSFFFYRAYCCRTCFYRKIRQNGQRQYKLPQDSCSSGVLSFGKIWLWYSCKSVGELHILDHGAVLCAYTYGYHTSAKGEASGDIQEKIKEGAWVVVLTRFRMWQVCLRRTLLLL